MECAKLLTEIILWRIDFRQFELLIPIGRGLLGSDSFY